MLVSENVILLYQQMESVVEEREGGQGGGTSVAATGKLPGLGTRKIQ